MAACLLILLQSSGMINQDFIVYCAHINLHNTSFSAGQVQTFSSTWYSIVFLSLSSGSAGTILLLVWKLWLIWTDLFFSFQSHYKKPAIIVARMYCGDHTSGSNPYKTRDRKWWHNSGAFLKKSSMGLNPICPKWWSAIQNLFTTNSSQFVLEWTFSCFPLSLFLTLFCASWSYFPDILPAPKSLFRGLHLK